MTEDFPNVNLQGRSFRNRDLSNQDFSGADIRGTKFDKAILKNANFIDAKAGLQNHWKIIWIIVSFLLALLSGILSIVASSFATQLLKTENIKELGNFGYLSSFLVLFILLFFCVVIIRRGVAYAVGTIAVIIAVAIPIAVGFDYIFVGQFAFIPTFAVFLPLSVAMLLIAAGVDAIALNLTHKIFGRAVTIVMIVTVAAAGVIPLQMQLQPAVWIETVAVIAAGFSNYLGWKATAANGELAWIQRITVAVVAASGTSFRGADLTNANFINATLKNTDFRNANLTRTCWFKARKINQACIEGTYLEEDDVRELVVTKNGIDKKFDHRNLTGLNLYDANLKNASFFQANLSEANLQNADLSQAKLVQTQLYRADLTKSCLTGAYIQDWGISTETKLEEVKCEYIYMHFPTENDPDPYRKPDNRAEKFKEGDFSDFIAPIIKTLDLYRSQNVDMREVGNTFKILDLFHHEGIDPSAAILALKQLTEKYPDAGIEVIALEGRGNEKIRLQAKVTGTANRSKLSAEYFQQYDENKNLPYSDLQGILAGMAEKDDRIQGLEEILKTAVQQSKFYVETIQNSGELIMSQSKGNIKISGVQGNVSGIAAAGENQTMTGVTLGQISGSVTNTISQLPNSSESDKPGIKELLAQLQAAIEAESDLSEEDKEEALKQVKTLAEAGQKPEDGTLQKAAKTAVKILKGTVSGLPDAAKLAEACTKLLPIISKVLLLV
jgi:uncharacterized protein YjbI with pentapeptide repeats